MLYRLPDIRMRRQFIEDEDAGPDRKRREHKRLDALLGYCEAPACRRTALLAVLKALRLALARERGVPAYVVFPDRALIDMVRRRPRSEAEFAAVNGVGAAKLKRFAGPFLAAIEAALPDTGDGAPSAEAAP